MKLKLLAAVCAFAIGSAASAQITETVTPLVPLSPSDQQILNVQQAERQIQANEQAVALERLALLRKPLASVLLLRLVRPRQKPKLKLLSRLNSRQLKRKPLLRNRNSKTIRIR